MQYIHVQFWNGWFCWCWCNIHVHFLFIIILRHQYLQICFIWEWLMFRPRFNQLTKRSQTKPPKHSSIYYQKVKWNKQIINIMFLSCTLTSNKNRYYMFLCINNLVICVTYFSWDIQKYDIQKYFPIYLACLLMYPK